MTKLNQIVAVEQGVKSATHSEISRLLEDAQRTQKDGPLHGIARTYTPRDDQGEQLPPESTRVQIKIDDLLDRAATVLTRLFDVTATKDWTNCDATADVTINGQVLLGDVPATYLLFLEKRLGELHDLVAKLPTLDPSETWSYSTEAGCWVTDPVMTTRTKKIPRNHVLAEATPHHPAQVQTYTEDVVVGTWRTVKFSGALPAERVREILRRITALQEGVVYARQAANNRDVTDQRVGKKVFDYLFA